MFQLTVKSGMTRGMSWEIGAAPLKIGRESVCDVRIPETVVSRQHCEIYLSGESLRLRHLGSVNPTLVNGLPALECSLHTGDEVRVGHVVFLITSTEAEPAEGGDAPRLSTDTLAEEDSVYLSTPSDRDASEVHPKTDGDLTELFHISRSLSRVTTQSALVAALAETVRGRFHPNSAWLLLSDHSGTEHELIDLLGPEPSVRDGLPELRESLSRTLRERRGILTPERVLTAEGMQTRCAMTAPIFFGENDIGAMLVSRTHPARVLHKTDLHFFVALAHIIAPFFRAIERVEQLEAENRNLRRTGEKFGRLIGSGKAMAEVQRIVRMVAPSLQPVLILGPTGTGKELVAGLIHELSGRAKEPLVTVNCAAIPRELFEGEFFGHEKGAFTGAVARKIGLLEQSNGGTLFLDEIGDLSPEHQARILRAVETGKFRRVGGQEEISSDFRIVTATNKDLQNEIKAGRFREDLYHRLRAVELRIPPLNQRRCDIPELAQHFLNASRDRAGTPERRLGPDAIEFLVELSWPGNVRELKHMIEVANTMCTGSVIDAEILRAIAPARDIGDVPVPLDELERRHIIKAIEYTNGNMVETARLLGIGRSTLYNKITHFHLKS